MGEIISMSVERARRIAARSGNPRVVVAHSISELMEMLVGWDKTGKINCKIDHSPMPWWRHD